MAAFTEMNEAQTASIQEWATKLVDDRMQMVGRAAEYVNSIDIAGKAAVGEIELQAKRTNDIVDGINNLYKQLEVKFVEVTKTMEEIPTIKGTVDVLFANTKQTINELQERSAASEPSVQILRTMTSEFADRIVQEVAGNFLYYA